MAETVRVPVTMIVEGVLAGSAGPLFYGADMLARTARKWDGMPVTYGHPTTAVDNGVAVGAKDRPDLIVGRVVEPRMAGGNRLRGVAEIDLDRLRKLDARMAWDIASRRKVEVSTGLFYSRDGQSGTWNGQSYRSAVVSMLPDHLALIPEGGQGACSVRDGCGLNNVKGEMDMGEQRAAIRTGPGRLVLVGDPERLDRLMEAFRKDPGVLVANAEEVDPELYCGCGGHAAKGVRNRDEPEPERRSVHWGIEGYAMAAAMAAQAQDPDAGMLTAPSLEAAMARDVAEAEVRNGRVKRLGGIDRDGDAPRSPQPQTDPATGEPVLGPPVWTW